MNHRLRTRRIGSEQGFTLMETLVAAVVFSGVFLVIFSLQSKVMMSFSGSDAIRVAQLADQALASFIDHGQIPNTDATLLVEGIKYRMTSRTETDDNLTKLWLTVAREITGDTIGTFYTERYAPKTK